ncbi:hypothetical protein [Sphingobium fuliginis]|uniref:Uncharacterized protein n=1 Tax=Sphingobium fuliginis ATCC 27551 TaxID=1208342 RepID=A0A5B8CGJ9_SPHSA|nr:hypothetical protein [Sphingobium fuliginis]QDC37110.1 hypothetical protein FIL70_07615 [Sphingobium fuliginis ATCC 27551]
MGKSKPKVEVTEYYMSDHFGICIGPVDALKALVIKEKTVWTGNLTEKASFEINQPDLFGGVKKEGASVALSPIFPAMPTRSCLMGWRRNSDARTAPAAPAIAASPASSLLVPAASPA